MAVARPMPLAPPVITAVLPFSSIRRPFSSTSRNDDRPKSVENRRNCLDDGGDLGVGRREGRGIPSTTSRHPNRGETCCASAHNVGLRRVSDHPPVERNITDPRCLFEDPALGLARTNDGGYADCVKLHRKIRDLNLQHLRWWSIRHHADFPSTHSKSPNGTERLPAHRVAPWILVVVRVKKFANACFDRQRLPEKFKELISGAQAVFVRRLDHRPRIARKVVFGTSAPRVPGTTTIPGRSRSRKIRWLPV